MAKKLSVSKSVSHQCSVIGLSCLHSDYRLLYFASKTLHFSFQKLDDLPLYNKKGKVGDFSFYHFEDKVNHLNYYLFSNKNEGKIAVSAHKNFDYFLLIDDVIDTVVQLELLSRLRSIPILQAAMSIPISSLKDLDILIEDIELHLIEIKKQKKDNFNLWIE
ncbi:MAG: IPExxxVDY family protein [Bacteroidales bacterium]|nr:IPExxxVDY family protein [Bacteroidales bacterium]